MLIYVYVHVRVCAHTDQKASDLPGTQVTGGWKLPSVGGRKAKYSLLTAKLNHLSRPMFLTLDPEFTLMSMLLKRLDGFAKHPCLLLFYFHLHLETPLGSSKFILPCFKKYFSNSVPWSTGGSTRPLKSGLHRCGSGTDGLRVFLPPKKYGFLSVLPIGFL